MKPLLFVLLILQLSSSLNAQQQVQSYELNSCIQYGLQHQPDLQQSMLEKQASDQLEKNAKLALLPDLNVNASVDHYWKIPVQAFPAELIGGEPGQFIPVRVGTPWTASGTLESNWDLINAELWKDIRVAALAKQMKENAYADQQAVLTKNITQAYYNVLLAEQQQVFAQSNLENYDTLNQINEYQFQQGTIEQLDRNRIRSLMLQAKTNFNQSQKNYSNALLQLKLWMGMPMDENLELANLSLETPEPAPDTAYVLEAHPQYRLASNRLLRQEAELGKANVGRLPTLSAYAAYTQTAFRNTFNFFDEAQDWYAIGSVGLRLHIPLFTRGQISNHIQVARYNAQIAEQQLKQLTQEKRQQYQSTLNDLNASISNIRQRKEMLDLAMENQKIGQYKYDNGVFTSADLLDVQREALEAQQHFLQAYADYYTAKAELQYLTANSL